MTGSEYYGSSIIRVTVTKRGYLKGNRLYKTSGAIRRGVAELRGNLIYKNIGT